jgi:hypothetical protein
MRLKGGSLIWGSVVFHMRGHVKQWAQLHEILCNQSRNEQLCKFSFLFSSLCSDTLWKFCVPTHRYRKKSSTFKLVVLSAILHYSFGFWIVPSNLNLWINRLAVVERKIGKSVPSKLFILDYWRIEMAPRKPCDLERMTITTKTDYEKRFWGYEEEGNGSLQCVECFQLTTNITAIPSGRAV